MDSKRDGAVKLKENNFVNEQVLWFFEIYICGNAVSAWEAVLKSLLKIILLL